MKAFFTWTFISSLFLGASFASGSINFVPVGCFRDKQLETRPLPELIHNYRLNNEMDWSDLAGSVIEPCAQEARNNNYMYFSLQFYGECWSGPRAHETYSRDGNSSACQEGVGKKKTNMVYRLAGEDNECVDYQTFDTKDRSVSYEEKTDTQCDDYFNGFEEGWYRFQGEAGTRLNSEFANNRCLTSNVAWYSGPYPDVTQGIISGKEVCLTEDCGRKTTMKIRNCGVFFVYHLVPVRGCPYRYCGNGIDDKDVGEED